MSAFVFVIPNIIKTVFTIIPREIRTKKQLATVFTEVFLPDQKYRKQYSISTSATGNGMYTRSVYSATITVSAGVASFSADAAIPDTINALTHIMAERTSRQYSIIFSTV